MQYVKCTANGKLRNRELLTGCVPKDVWGIGFISVSSYHRKYDDMKLNIPQQRVIILKQVLFSWGICSLIACWNVCLDRTYML